MNAKTMARVLRGCVVTSEFEVDHSIMVWFLATGKERASTITIKLNKPEAETGVDPRFFNKVVEIIGKLPRRC